MSLVAGVARGADLYVDASAAGGGDGSAGAPLQQIQEGLALAQPGDVVHVAPGSYAPITTVRAGTADAPIQVIADRSRTAIVQADGTGLSFDHDYHRFEGLVVDGAYGSGDLVRGGGGNHIAFVDVEVRRAGSDCIDLRTASDILIEDSEIHHCVALDGGGAVQDSHGVTGDSVFDLTIRNTDIGMISGDCVQMSPARLPWGNLLIESSVLWTAPLDDADAGVPVGTPIGENAFDSKVGDALDGNGANPTVVIRDTIVHGFEGFISNQAAFNIKEAVDATIERVTVYDSELGFRLRGPALARVRNAVIHDVDNAVRYEDGITGVELSNVTLGGGITGERFEDGGGGGWSGASVENLLVLDGALPPDAAPGSSLSVGPEAFVDAAAHDYHLVEGAAAIDAGVALAAVADDRDGIARPYGAGYDVGAYEWDPDAGADTTGGDATGGADSGSGGDAGGSGSDASASAGSDASASAGGSGSGDDSGGTGSGAAGDEAGGCGCATTEHVGSGLAMLIALALRRRRR
ncbi:MAG: choice-of-anchor Q domain-containing protein [Nannocystaceae bacterium]